MRYLIFLFLVIFIVSCNKFGTKLTKNNCDVYFTKNVSQDETVKMMAYLNSMQFFDGKERMLQLDKSNNIYVVKMVVKPELVGNNDQIEVAKALARDLSVYVFNGEPVHFYLCNNNLEVLKDAIPSRFFGVSTSFNKGNILHKPTVPKENIQKLGGFLVENEIFDKEELTIEYICKDKFHSINFIIAQEFMSDSTTQIMYSALRKTISEEVFNKEPVDLFFCNEFFEPQIKIK